MGILMSKQKFVKEINRLSCQINQMVKIAATTVIRHLFDFSYKLCHCYRNSQLLGSTLNQKGEQMYRSYGPVSGSGNGVFFLDILMKAAIRFDCRFWQEI